MKIRVFFPVFLVISLFFLCDVAIWVLIIFVVGLETLEWLGIIIFLVLFVVLPLFTFLYSLFTFTNVIEFSEKEIKRIRFGKVIRCFEWEEVKTIASTEGNTFAGWIYISNKEKSYDYQHVGKMRSDREVIYFHQSKKAQQALLTYAPERFKTQKNQWITN